VEKNRIISAIIPSYNSAATIDYTINSLLHQKGHFLKEIIIVDSSDDDRVMNLSGKYISSAFKYINSGKHIIPAIQRNIGAKAASGKILAFFDSDVILSPNYLEIVESYYQKGYLVGFGSIDLPLFQQKKLLPLVQYYLQLNEYLPVGTSREKKFPTGCNNYCDKTIFMKIGGYPAIRASEDVLFGLEIHKYTTILFIPHATVSHIFREDWKSFYNNQFLLGEYVAFYKREKSYPFYFKSIIPIILFPLFLILKTLRISSRIFSAGWEYIYKFILVFPVLFLGLIFWTMGFTKGSITKKKVFKNKVSKVTKY